MSLTRRMLFGGAGAAVLAKPAIAQEPEVLLKIKAIRHRRQRYATVGDWRVSGTKDNPAFAVTVSRLSDWRYELLVGLHEAVEAALCEQRGIGEAAVTAFDEAFEAKRVKGNVDEPGDDPSAPYHFEHVFATKVEKLMADELGVNWATYAAEVEAL